MLLAPIPDNEAERLTTLRNLNTLDTEAEERFDRITRLAKRLFDVPICLVSLVDENRQWFKSCFGLSATETARDISFCGHAILQDDVFVIEDTLEDKRFFDNPLVTEAPFIRFYAGFPLKLGDNVRIGTLCIISDKPRVFGKDDQIALEDLGQMVISEFSSLQQNTIDALTGISNRRGFDVLAKKSIAHWDRSNTRSALVFFDLDFFKQINDQYGHDEGDQALSIFAKLLTLSFRESDVIARFAGDEFVVLVSCVEENSVTSAVLRFDSQLQEHNNTSNKPFKLSYSFGVSTREAKSETTIKDMLIQADQAMFKVKALHHQQQ